MINQEQLNAIKERVAKATHGPWKVAYDTDDRDHVVDIWFNGEENGHAEIHDNSFGNAPDNARFISRAREDVPALVAEVERLKIELDAARIANTTLKSEKKGFREANERLTADLFERIEFNGKFAKQNIDAAKENEQLRKALEKVMEVEAPIMEGWETPAYKIAREALGGETK